MTDDVMHKTLGKLSFPRDMPYSHRNLMIAELEQQHASREGGRGESPEPAAAPKGAAQPKSFSSGQHVKLSDGSHAKVQYFNRFANDGKGAARVTVRDDQGNYQKRRGGVKPEEMTPANDPDDQQSNALPHVSKHVPPGPSLKDKLAAKAIHPDVAEKHVRSGKMSTTDMWNAVRDGKLKPHEAGRIHKAVKG